MSGQTAAAPSLRERKKQRTRQDLAESALRLFHEQGYDATTLDELVESVQVSKRTFFRYFESKEAVAVAAEAELWDAYIDAVDRSASDGEILATLRDALVEVTGSLPGDWPERLFRTRALMGRTPELRAASMMLAARTQDRLITMLAPRLGIDAKDLRLRLAVEIALGAYRCGARDWISDRKRGGGKVLADRIRAAFDAVPGATSLVGPATAQTARS
ncbi:TetR family transcriptional regulator [Actinomadura sp. 6K520]|uniref:TetR family transcriptional regulator n=1 Tax=Actinomadura sp. 6K520 TaxID=2530364 RepID=UPI00104B2231|nr:TetR family transcriptional regulator [Actinomadura sp. 6K520]TDE21352.1 TetR family transcriptional regulator [Actinomadura sp. 6K520]